MGRAVSLIYSYSIVLKRSCRGSGKCYVYLVLTTTLCEIFSPGKQEKDYSYSSPNEHDWFWKTFWSVEWSR